MGIDDFNISELMKTNVGSYTVERLLNTVLIALVCLLVIRLSRRMLSGVMSRSKLNQRMQKYITTAVKVLLYVLSFIIVADYLGINMNSLVALLSVGSLGLTLAAEDILGNVAGGFIILSSHLFSVGDYIEVNGVGGTVKEISLNHTRLATLDGLLVLLPNKELASSKVVNYSALGLRRVQRKVTASYDAPTDEVKAACREAIAAVDNVLPEPAPSVYLSDYGESAIEYSLYCWTKPESYWQVYYGVGEALRDCFKSHGVEMTYNHMNVHILDK